MERFIKDIIEGVSNTYGNDFFEQILLQLQSILNADYVFIAKVDKDKHLSTTVALCAKGQIVDNFSYSLAHTPCENVMDNTVCCYPCKVYDAFPKDQLLLDMKIEAYLGTPLLNSKKETMGLIAAMYEKPFPDEALTQTLFKVFSGRVAAEMERLDYEHNLSDKVNERTAELNQTLENLKDAQSQLIESEKMAMLGKLIAGVAHEVDTPLGISITAFSIIEDNFKNLQQKLHDKTLKLSEMEEALTVMDDAVQLQRTNLFRAKELIENFKQTAVDQNNIEAETINIEAYYNKIISTITPLLRRKKIDVQMHCPSELSCKTFPGIHAQIITNLINNSVMHAFDGTSDNTISFTIQDKVDTVEVHYQDNGKGISEDIVDQIFEPFFTTAKDNGGSGLGMSIINNLIRQQLKGDIKCLPAIRGSYFLYTFKK